MAEPPTDRDRFEREELGEVLSHYDIGVIKSAKEFTRGSRRAPKLVLETPSGRYLLKRRAVGRDDPVRVAFTHALMMHLQSKGFPVPAIIGTCDDDNSMLQLGHRVYEMFEFIDGERCGNSLEETMRAGQTLAYFHAAVCDFRSEWQPPVGSYHRAPNVRAGLNAIPTVSAGNDSVIGHEEDLLQLTQSLHEDYQAAADAAAERIPVVARETIIHGDWHPGNMLFRDGRVVAVIDFDAARRQPPVVDVAYGMLQFSILRAATAPDLWPDFFDEARMRRFLAGYRDEAGELDPAQRLAVPDLMIEALIAEAALPIAVTGSFGRLPGFGVLQMVARKVRWLQENADRMRRWLSE